MTWIPLLGDTALYTTGKYERAWKSMFSSSARRHAREDVLIQQYGETPKWYYTRYPTWDWYEVECLWYLSCENEDTKEQAKQ